MTHGRRRTIFLAGLYGRTAGFYLPVPGFLPSLPGGSWRSRLLCHPQYLCALERGEIVENRRHQGYSRFPVKVPAAVLTAEPAAIPEIGLALDLSRGGILLRLGSAKAPGMPIRVTLTFRHRPQLVLTGKVVWSHPHLDFPGWDMGIQLEQELHKEMVIEIADEQFPPWAIESPADRAGTA